MTNPGSLYPRAGVTTGFTGTSGISHVSLIVKAKRSMSLDSLCCHFLPPCGTSNFEHVNRNCAAQFRRDFKFWTCKIETVQHSFGGTSNFVHENRNCAAQFRRDFKFCTWKSKLCSTVSAGLKFLTWYCWLRNIRNCAAKFRRDFKFCTWKSKLCSKVSAGLQILNM